MGPTELEWLARRTSGWSISSDGMVTERAFRSQQHGELAEEAVGAAGGPLDLDEPLEEAAAGALEDALAEQVAGGVGAPVPRVAGQVEALVAATERDLGLVHAAAAPDEHVVDPALDVRAADHGQRPGERRGFADGGVTVHERDGVRPEVLLPRDVQRGAAVEHDLRGAHPERLAGAVLRTRRRRPAPPGSVAWASRPERHDGAGEQRPSGLALRPPDHDRAGQLDAVRDVDEHARA